MQNSEQPADAGVVNELATITLENCAPPLQLDEKIAALQKVEMFADLPGEQLQWFAENAVEHCLEPGEILFRRGDIPDWMVVMLSGETHARRDDATLDGNVYISRAGDPATEVTGKLPFSRMKTFEATGRAVVPTRLLLFPVRLFPELLQQMPLLAERLVWNMSDRVRESTRIDEQRDKLMSLGKLSAGLAHELNNPAAAAKSAAAELLETLENLREADLRLCRHHLPGETREFLAEFERDCIERSQNSTSLSTVEQSDREDTLGTWLDDYNVEEAWTFAHVLVNSETTTEQLAELREKVGADVFADALARIAAQLTTAHLVTDIETSARRISELVGAIKEYSYMDRAPVQDVDIHKALENTLIMLKHKLKTKNVNVTRDYAVDLPRLTALGSELNQMWTNLIDNAVDAMPQSGQLQIRTRLEPDAVMVEICDNGAGIPPEIQQQIFDPFFTTKQLGEGTGLGLDIVMRIVRHHHGNIRFQSQPGDTSFQVRLPLQSKIVT